MPEILNVNMLGEFSLEYKGQRVDDSSNRMRKVWLLLAYLIYSRNSRLTQEQLVNLLQGPGGDAADAGGRLKAILYRARSMLNQLDGSAGHDWIIRRNGTYCWNPDVPVRLDAEVFESLCRDAAAAEGTEEEPALCLRALELYRGDFLPKLGMEVWVIPIAAYYHQMFLKLTGHTLALLEQRERWSEALPLCEKALRMEPYSEELYQHLMRCRISTGNRAGAAAAFEEMREALYSNFSIMPSEESRKLYREATQEDSFATLPPGGVMHQLYEPGRKQGAFYCEYDFFKLLYQVQARAIVRSGEVIHIALLSVTGQNGKALPRRSLDRAMDNLQETIRGNLRAGDVYTRCSVSQFVIMLPQASYENSGKVCQRVIRAFTRQYPHSPAQLSFSVEPLGGMYPPTGDGDRP